MIKIKGAKDIKELAKSHGKNWSDSHDVFKEVIDLPPDIRAKMEEWILALESGEYPQARGRLYSEGSGYCCLGVAMHIAGIPKKDILDIEVPGNIETAPRGCKFVKGFINKGVHWYPGFMENELTYMNDDMQFSFEEIAAILRWKYDI